AARNLRREFAQRPTITKAKAGKTRNPKVEIRKKAETRNPNNYCVSECQRLFGYRFSDFLRPPDINLSFAFARVAARLGANSDVTHETSLTYRSGIFRGLYSPGMGLR